jgi:cobalt-precorrin 5A hydrolase
MRIAIVSVTKQGDGLAERLRGPLQAEVFSKNNINNMNTLNPSDTSDSTNHFDIKALTKSLMESYQGIIFIASTGIAVRAIAPFLKGKEIDPAVLVVDSTGKFVISLLSGHLGGANELTIKAAELLKAQPVITTASDNMGFTAPDIVARDNGLVIEDMKKAKELAALMVAGKSAAFIDEEKLISLPRGYIDAEHLEEAEAVLWVTNRLSVEADKPMIEKISAPVTEGGALVFEARDSRIKTGKPVLRLLRKNIILGIGCRKDYEPERMRENLLRTLKEHNIDYRSVGIIATVEVKKDEAAIKDLAAFLKCELKIFSIEDIKKVQHSYEGSDFVEKTIGIRAVCEPCVELAGGELLTGKISCDGMTLCIGKVAAAC